MIIDHSIPEYHHRWSRAGVNRWNGAYYYSKEIVKNIIPKVETDRHWVTINQKPFCPPHSIVFIHNNKHPDNYAWLAGIHDLVLVCGIPETCEKVEHLGKSIYLPLSIDVEQTMKHRHEKTKGLAFAGRPAKRKGIVLPPEANILEGMPQGQLLDRMSEHERVMAVGRCAIQAKALGCEVVPYDDRFPDPTIWNVIDNSEAAVMLQMQLDHIDRRGI